MIARAERHRMACPFVLLTGGKGGVGKSTLAANLAVTLSGRGLRTLLVDLDLGLANLDVLLKLERRAPLEDLLSGYVRLEDCIVEGPRGLAVLPAASGVRELANPDEWRRGRLLRELARVSLDYDFILGDSAAGIGDDVVGFAAEANRVIAVTAPDPAAVTDAYGLIKALDAWSRSAEREIPTPEVVINFAAGAEEARRVGGRLRSTSERFLSRSPRLLGWLPRSKTVLTSAIEQRPFVVAEPRAAVSRRLEALADRITPSSVSALKPHVDPAR